MIAIFHVALHKIGHVNYTKSLSASNKDSSTHNLLVT